MSLIHFKCDCGKEFRVSSRYAGGTATCRRCGNVFNILAVPAPRESVDDRIDQWLEGSLEEQMVGALKKKRLGELRRVIAAGADPMRADQDTLYLAVLTDNPDIVRAVLEAGADPDGDVDSEHPPPLACAAARGSAAVVRLIVEAGADPNLEAPLVIAVRNADTAVARVLIDGGADLTDERLLPAAFKSEDLAMFAFLFQAGVKPDPVALGKMLVHRRTAGDLDVTRVLLEAGADVNATDKNGATALMHAAHLGRMDAVRLLLRFGADPTYRRRAIPRTAAEAADNQGHDRIVEVLNKAAARS